MKKVVVSRTLVLFTIGMFMLVLREAHAQLPLSLPAMPLTLAWNAADDSSVSGYALYYGLASQPATNRVDAGSNTSATVYGLDAGLEYRVYAVSYDVAGMESVPSNELSVTLPAVSRLRLVRQLDGSMQLIGKAAPGTVWNVLFTASLQSPAWATLRQATADLFGNLVTVDATAKQAESRFYRVAFSSKPTLGGAQTP